MDRTMEYCWRMAKEYTRRAEETTDEETRQFFYRTRDNWIRVASQQEITRAAAETYDDAGKSSSETNGFGITCETSVYEWLA